ncbi:MAG: hypothetical protein HYV47_02955 [Candidatus Nealsonbacteria bacterium]|nr:hypothetical protein [Candidatus Nealsonbacteria bacterium]
MDINIDELLQKNQMLRPLAEFGKKEGIKFDCYINNDGIWLFFARLNSEPVIMIPVSQKLDCILPIIDSEPYAKKFVLAHELGHARNYWERKGCPHSECFSKRIIGESCFYEERRAWLNGADILKEVCQISPEEKKRYFMFALRVIKTQARVCIRRLAINPAEIFQDA